MAHCAKWESRISAVKRQLESKGKSDMKSKAKRRETKRSPIRNMPSIKAQRINVEEICICDLRRARRQCSAAAAKAVARAVARRARSCVNKREAFSGCAARKQPTPSQPLRHKCMKYRSKCSWRNRGCYWPFSSIQALEPSSSPCKWSMPWAL